MQIPDIVDTILNFIPTINLDETSSPVSLFETTIRYLGGMLSGSCVLLQIDVLVLTCLRIRSSDGTTRKSRIEQNCCR